MSGRRFGRQLDPTRLSSGRPSFYGEVVEKFARCTLYFGFVVVIYFGVAKVRSRFGMLRLKVMEFSFFVLCMHVAGRESSA